MISEYLPNTRTYNDWVRDQWIDMWVRNSARTYRVIEDKFKKENCDLSTEIADPSKPRRPCLLLGSGPSLDDMVPYLKEWKGAIMCSTSQLALLEYLGVQPTYVWLLDADPLMTYLVSDYPSKKSTATMLTHVSIQREAVTAWKGRIRFFKTYDPADTFFTKYLKMMYQVMNEKKDWGVRTYILNTGCIVNTAVTAAANLGLGPVFMCGVDFGFPEDKYRFSNPKKTRKGWIVEPPPPIPEGRNIRIGHNGIKTDDVSLFYKYAFMNMYGINPGDKDVFTCSRGILDEIPYIEPKEVVRRQGKGFEHLIVPEKEAYKIAQHYLAPRKIFILNTGHMKMVQDPRGYGPIQLIRFYWRWLRWKDSLDWEGNSKRYAKRAMADYKYWRGRTVRTCVCMGYDAKESPKIEAGFDQMEDPPKVRFWKIRDQAKLGLKHKKMAQGEKR